MHKLTPQFSTGGMQLNEIKNCAHFIEQNVDVQWHVVTYSCPINLSLSEAILNLFVRAGFDSFTIARRLGKGTGSMTRVFWSGKQLNTKYYLVHFLEENILPSSMAAYCLLRSVYSSSLGLVMPKIASLVASSMTVIRAILAALPSGSSGVDSLASQWLVYSSFFSAPPVTQKIVPSLEWWACRGSPGCQSSPTNSDPQWARGKTKVWKKNILSHNGA